MEQRVLGKTGIKTSVLGFGGAEIGFNEVDVEKVKRSLNEAIDGGLNLIDTAAAYLKSEALIGDAVGHRRKDYTLVTKCGAIDGFNRSDWTKEGILNTVRQSLKNLKTDHLDVLLLHSCGELEMAWGEALQGVEAAKEAGYTRFIGYSGDGPAALWAVNSGRIDVFETSLNIADQEAIELTLPAARKNNLGVIVKRPVANAAWRHTETPENDYHLEYWKRFGVLKYPFATPDSAHAVSVALRFTLSQPGVHCAIVGSTNPGRWKENAEIVREGALPQPEIDKIRARWREVADVTWVGKI